jgi:hypothetical protein
MALLLSRDPQVQPQKSLLCGNTRVRPSGAIRAFLSKPSVPPKPPPPLLPNTWEIPVQIPRRCNVVVSSCGIWIQTTSTQNPARKPSQIPPHTPHSLRTRGHCRPRTHSRNISSLSALLVGFCPSFQPPGHFAHHTFSFRLLVLRYIPAPACAVSCFSTHHCEIPGRAPHETRFEVIKAPAVHVRRKFLSHFTR